jgi:hypothetical protein
MPLVPSLAEQITLWQLNLGSSDCPREEAANVGRPLHWVKAPKHPGRLAEVGFLLFRRKGNYHQLGTSVSASQSLVRGALETID